MARVLIVAGSDVERAGLEALLAASPSVTVVATTLDRATLDESVAQSEPDVVLIALDADDVGLAQAPVELQTGVVALVADPDAVWIGEALRLGVRGLLPRSATGAEIVAAVEAAAVGLTVLHPEFAESLASDRPETAKTLALPVERDLTPREAEVLSMLAEGASNKEIAWRMKISEHTVKFHISSIFTKLDASSRTEAVTAGIRRGMIML